MPKVGFNPYTIKDSTVEIHTVPYKGASQTILIDLEDLVKVKTYRWFVDQKGYVRSSKLRKFLHCHILNYPLKQIDHKNSDKLDNRRSNLRLVTNQQNSWNKPKANRNSRSGYKGVTYNKRDNNWRSVLSLNGKRYELGRYDTPLEAHKAYVAKILELHKQYSPYK